MREDHGAAPGIDRTTPRRGWRGGSRANRSSGSPTNVSSRNRSPSRRCVEPAGHAACTPSSSRGARAQRPQVAAARERMPGDEHGATDRLVPCNRSGHGQRAELEPRAEGLRRRRRAARQEATTGAGSQGRRQGRPISFSPHPGNDPADRGGPGEAPRPHPHRGRDPPAAARPRPATPRAGAPAPRAIARVGRRSRSTLRSGSRAPHTGRSRGPRRGRVPSGTRRAARRAPAMPGSPRCARVRAVAHRRRMHGAAGARGPAPWSAALPRVVLDAAPPAGPQRVRQIRVRVGTAEQEMQSLLLERERSRLRFEDLPRRRETLARLAASLPPRATHARTASARARGRTAWSRPSVASASSRASRSCACRCWPRRICDVGSPRFRQKRVEHEILLAAQARASPSRRSAPARSSRASATRPRPTSRVSATCAMSAVARSYQELAPSRSPAVKRCCRGPRSPTTRPPHRPLLRHPSGAAPALRATPVKSPRFMRRAAAL